MNNDVWVIDDDRSIRWVLERALKKADLNVTLFESATNAIHALAEDTPQGYHYRCSHARDRWF